MNIRHRSAGFVWVGLVTAVLLLAFVWLVAGAAGDGSGRFADSGQSLGNAITNDIALGDLDGDDDLDAFAANDAPNRVWTNDGLAAFASHQVIAGPASYAVALGDVDGNLTLDAFLANDGPNQVWLNDGAATFADSGQSLGGATLSLDVALADLDGDTDLDAFVANDGPNQVWMNDGAGAFTDSGQALGAATSNGVALGDVNGDGFLDAVIANGTTFAQASTVWLNDGAGQFTDSGQLLDTSWNYRLALGDLDGDADLDVFLTSWTAADTIWINQGGAQGGTVGTFLDSGQALSGSGSIGLDLADVDGDSDLDVIIGRWFPESNEVWVNQGGDQGGAAGIFLDSGEELDDAGAYAVTLGDMDGDLDSDVMFGNFGPNSVWLNGGGPLSVFFAVDARRNPNGAFVYPWAQVGDAALPVQLSAPPTQTVVVNGRIQQPGGVLTETLTFAPGQTAQPLVVANPGPAVSQPVTLTLSIADSIRAWLAGLEPPSDQLSLLFVDAGAGPNDCLLCFADWLLKLLGFEPTFTFMHQVEAPALEASPVWPYYTALFDQHAPQMTAVVAANPTLLWDLGDTLQSWTPVAQALGDGQGSTVVISATLVAETDQVLDAFEAAADPELKSVLQQERAVLNLPSYVGLTVDEAVAQLQERPFSVQYLPVIAGGGSARAVQQTQRPLPGVWNVLLVGLVIVAVAGPASWQRRRRPLKEQ